MKWLGTVTPLGYAVLILGTVSAFLGWNLGWIEFLVLACGAGLGLLIAIPFVVGGHNLELTREIEPRRVEVDGSATSVLTVTNNGANSSSPRSIEDVIDGKQLVVDVPGLSAGAQSQAIKTLPTGRRGVIQVGPAELVKTDPLGLLRRYLGRSTAEELWVHPHFKLLPSLRSGLVRDLEGPTFDNSPAGDIAFHAIREYSPGDDIRHIHWMSTARTATLMVRHYVDNRRPFLGIFVDDDPNAMTPDQFELALQIAASHAISASIDRRPLALWVGSQAIASSESPASQDIALDRLCLSQQRKSDRSIADNYEHLRRVDSDISAFVLITGPRSAEELLPPVTQARKNVGVVVFRCLDEGDAAVTLPRAATVNCSTLDDAVSGWIGASR